MFRSLMRPEPMCCSSELAAANIGHTAKLLNFNTNTNLRPRLT